MTFLEMLKQIYKDDEISACMDILDDNNGEYLKTSRKEVIEKALAYTGIFSREKGTRIGIYMDGQTAWLSVFFAIVITGNVAVLLDKRLKTDTILNYVSRTDTKRVVFDKIDSGLQKKLSESLGKENIISCKKTVSDGGVVLSLYTDNTDENEACAILFTSGTTGIARGVILSQKNILMNIMDTIELGCFSRKERFFSMLPVAHAFGMNQATLAPFFNGGSILFSNSPLTMMDNIHRFQPSVVLTIPMMLEFFYKKLIYWEKKSPEQNPIDTAHKVLGENIRYIGVGGADTNPNVVVGLRKFGIFIASGYGMTETSPLITSVSSEKMDPFSVGKPLKHVKIKIVDGEIFVSGQSVMIGYDKDPEATNEVLKEGWFKTGDLGYLNEKGELFLKGRSKNLIILSNGENISPEYVEGLLMRDHCIKEARVSERNDRIFAEIVVEEAFSELTKENGEEKIKAVVKSVNNQLPSYSQIMDFVITKEGFARNLYGKLVR